eukprot:scaffold208650_cov27-Tisochrysis_lutea.AAC.1
MAREGDSHPTRRRPGARAAEAQRSASGARRGYDTLPGPLRALIDEPLAQPRRPSELSVLKQTVAGLYHDTRAWVAEEDEMRELVAWLHDKVNLLQRAFHSLSDCLVEEVENLRSRADQQAANVDEALQQAREVARLKQELTMLSQARANHTSLVSELTRHREGQASEVKRMGDAVAAVREEMAEMRAASEREARAERAARVKLQEYVAALESRLAQQDAIVQAHAQQLKTAQAALDGLNSDGRHRPLEGKQQTLSETKYITADERKRRQWREQVLSLAEEPDLQPSRHHSALASLNRLAAITSSHPTYLKATKPAYLSSPEDT